MKLEHRALLQTTGIVLGIIAAGVLMSIITANMSLETGMYLAGAVFFAIFFRLIYNVVLDRLWMGQHLKDYDKSA
jgi:uncharacterized membrane protein YccC